MQLLTCHSVCDAIHCHCVMMPGAVQGSPLFQYDGVQPTTLLSLKSFCYIYRVAGPQSEDVVVWANPGEPTLLLWARVTDDGRCVGSPQGASPYLWAGASVLVACAFGAHS